MKPACMADADWTAWLALNALTRGTDRADSPCRDCTAAYAAEMGAECDGEPGPVRPPLTSPELRAMSVAELRVLRATLPRFGAPKEVGIALRRARWREYRRRLKVTI